MPLNLDDVYYLPRSGIYSAPKNSNDPLPIVYGNLTDGTEGIWPIPCINTTNSIYCFAGHEVLSAANGNTVTVYADGVTVNPANYTFSHLNNYESLGNISTITFSTPPDENAEITVKGKGKPTTSGGATLMDNIVDILYDFLVTHSGQLAEYDFHVTSKNKSRTMFDDQGYFAAGVINSDNTYWHTIYQMLGSFKGEAFVNTDNKLVVVIDDGTFIGMPNEIVGKGDLEFISLRLMRENIVNRLPAQYAFNYVNNEFAKYADDVAFANARSINMYGLRRAESPYEFHFCREIGGVNTVQTIITGLHGTAEKISEIEFKDLTLRRSNVELGDYVIASFDNLYGADGLPLVNAIFKVLEISTDYNKCNITFRCIDTGAFLTVAYLLDGEGDVRWLELQAGGQLELQTGSGLQLQTNSARLLDGTWLLGGEKDTTVY